MRKIALLFASAAALVLAACASATDADDAGEDVETETAESAASLASTSTYYSVRPDYRRCIYPLCGGYFVKRVNRAWTRCADGTWARECYVAEIDWAAAGLTAADVGDPSRTLLRGTVEQRTIANRAIGAFAASEAWRAGASGAQPTGNFYRVADRGLVCITWPCFSLGADKLNSTVSRALSGLDGAHGAAVSALLAKGPVLASGAVHATPRGPAGSGRALAVSQYWTRVTPEPPADPLACDTDADCTTSAYDKVVTSPSECYCALCPHAIVNNTTADLYSSSWEKHCSDVMLMCPLAMCVMPPPVACVDHQCKAAPDPAVCPTPSVAPSDPYYGRFEAPTADNACTSDADCTVSGCSGEVCAAESLFTTCEALPRHPAGSCGCVAGACQWNTPGACR